MINVELTRAAGEHHVYLVEGFGKLRLEGIASRSAIAEADGESWRIARRHFWASDIEATDAGGSTVGWFHPRGLRRGGTLRWADRELALRPASQWRERYALAEADSELATFDGKGWGRTPVRITIDDPTALAPGLMLFATFIVIQLAEDASGAAGAAAATAAMG